MSLGQTLFGAGAIAALLQAAWSTVGFVPPPIIVHSLTYHEGRVTQDRTVTRGPAWVAQWQAAVVDDLSGEVVPNCKGDGFWPYPKGRSAPTMSLGEWVGNPLCRLPPGTYYLRAIYTDGSTKVPERGDVFRVPE